MGWVLLSILGIWVGLIVVLSRLAKRRQNAKANGQVLLRATEVGDVEAMQALLDQGAAINVSNAQGWTPLHVAAASGDIAVIELLLGYGADVNAASNIGTTPLYNTPVLARKPAVIKLLLDHGAHPDGTWELISPLPT
ncbi:hypothetical protein NKDENANG_03175 [Candidatus Entotheonellaceae bacterium PAL068K]